MTIKEEFDASELAFELYQKAYRDLFSEIQVTSDKPRRYFSAVLQHNKKRLEGLEYSGDTDFNIKKKNSRSNYYLYWHFIKEIPDTELRAKYCFKLDICEKLRESVLNISIMPKKGGLNLTKKGIGNDRIDTFIWALDQYYSAGTNLLINASTYQHMGFLYDYLNLFDGVKDYCKTIYHINGSLVDNMIESGKNAIDSPERVIEYMNLASRFWRQKLRYYNSIEDFSEQIKSEVCSASKLLKKIST